MDDLEIRHRPRLVNPRMVLGFSGWMDGGSVSTGTLGYLVDKLEATAFGSIRPHDFYVLNLPISTIPLSLTTEEGRPVLTAVNPMEIAALFRPHTRIEGGVIRELTFARNEFFCAEASDVVLFVGEEPHIRWGAFAECLFNVAEDCGVREILFVGSVAAPLPHTREPRVRASMGEARLRSALEGLNVGLSEYEGPASFVTYLAHESVARGLELRSLVVEVPHYPFIEMPAYPRSILLAVEVVCRLTGLTLDLSDLRRSAEVVESRLDGLAQENETFGELVRKLEGLYDRQTTDPDHELLKRLMEGIDLTGDGEQAGE